MIRRIPSDQVPPEIKEKISTLKKDVKDYVLIGDSYYEIRPFSMIKIIGLFNEITSLINEAKELVSEEEQLSELTEGKSTKIDKPISLRDILSNKELKDKLIETLMKIFEGIDKVDFESMNIAQFNELLNKIWTVNLNAFPDEKSKNEFIARIVSILVIINPNIYRFAMNTQFMDDISIIMQRNPKLAEQINEELRKLYAERMEKEIKEKDKVH